MACKKCKEKKQTPQPIVVKTNKTEENTKKMNRLLGCAIFIIALIIIPIMIPVMIVILFYHLVIQGNFNFGQLILKLKNKKTFKIDNNLSNANANEFIFGKTNGDLNLTQN